MSNDKHGKALAVGNKVKMSDGRTGTIKECGPGAGNLLITDDAAPNSQTTQQSSQVEFIK